MIYRDRFDAGRQLAEALEAFADHPDVLVLALPRGGVPVGFAIAQALHVPLDVLMVRKLGVPGREELAMGALASGGVRLLNDEIIAALEVTPEEIDAVVHAEQVELERREQLYRAGRPAPDVRDKVLILVDDGLATGSTMRAAVATLRRQGPARVIVAVPVGSSDTCAELRREADDVICIRTPEPFYAVGMWYSNFSQTSDTEVCQLLARAAALVRSAP